VFLVLGRNRSGKQFNKANTLQGNFEAAVFFATENTAAFFSPKIKKKGWMHHEK
jgi:hypothetical protein